MSAIIAKLARQLATIVTAASVLAGVQAAQAAGNVDQAVGALAYAPQTETLYKSDGQALYRSEGGGKQWTKVPLGPLPDGGRVAAVAVSAGEQSQLYVAGTGLGVLKSIDAGKSWSHVDQGLPNRDVIAFATHSTVPDTLYAVVAGQGIYRSEDGGAHWRMVDKGPQAQIRLLIHSDLEGSMQTGWLFAATDKGVYRSMDCFCGWRSAGDLSHAVSAVAYDPKQPMTVYAAAGRQVFRTTDGGEGWQMVGSPGDDVGALAHSPAGVLYALLTDGRVVRSEDKGGRWE
ncbi:MAG: hypothetical protein HYX38_05360 [Rhodospirillales bacterium]|nr:hypothetical protein [Rhodospirillales bacterium]